MNDASLKNTPDINLIREKCLSNAESLISVAERELGKKVDHICFHLSLLALEEIGKSILVTIGHTVSVAEREKPGLTVALDDHVKKIFWALWGGMFRDDKFTKVAIEENRGLATALHEKRLYYLYTDPNNPSDPAERIKDGEAVNLTKLVRSRLELEKAVELNQTMKNQDVDDLKWFFSASEDPEHRKFIFSTASINKLQELTNGKEWIKWLRDIFRKNEDEMRALAENEIRRQKPSGNERFVPKYKMKIRIQSQSHTVRNNAFQKWNEGVENIKIYKSDRKDSKKTTKSEVIIDFIFPKAIPPAALWNHGFFMAKTLTVALNIATNGIFWWNVQKDIEKYYEEIIDLEASKKEDVKLRVTIGKRLAINWDDARLVLDQDAMRQVNLIFAFLMRENRKLESFLKSYSLGLTAFSKTDIHLRLEVNAFEEFFQAFKHALFIFRDWDGKSELKKIIHNQFDKIGELSDLDDTVQLGLNLNPKEDKIPKITLTEVMAIKLYTDLYIKLKAQEYFDKLKHKQA